MSLDLDERQRAMLAEMGVPVWWQPQAPEATVPGAPDTPQPVRAEVPSPVVAARPRPEPESVSDSMVPPAPHDQPEPTRAAPVAVLRPAAKAPTQVLPMVSGIAAMDWAELAHSVHQCQACALCLGRQAPVVAPPTGNQQAHWLVLGEPPDDAQERAGAPFVGDAGLLLDNMLAAVGVARMQTAPDHPAQRAYLSLVMKCRPAVPAAPDAQALADCAQYLQREVALVQPKVILAMGRLAMRVLLSQEPSHVLSLPLGKLRGQVWRYQGVPVVVTYPPDYLLRSPQDKARAWQDLCLARRVVQDTN